jgi:FAD/FMN-containing dehydrogenase/Fe-S oxidoreductase
VKGDVLCDEISRTLYSTAACIFRVVPRGVVAPRDRDDVVAVVRYAAERGIPVTGRGGGSGLAGQTLGEGLILDFSKYMNRVVETRPEEFRVRVQPGITLGNLNRHLKPHGLWFPPDPSSGEVATLGGMIANNAAGAHTVKYGATREYVQGLDCVLDDGSGTGGERWRAVESRVRALLEGKRDVVERNRPDTVKNSSGYHVFDPAFEMHRLIVGSEGTLALVAEATLRVIRKPTERTLLRIYFDDLVTMGEAVVALRPFGPSALEVIDKTTIDLVRGSIPEWNQAMPATLRSILLCEFDGASKDEVAAAVSKAKGVLGRAIEVKEASGGEYENLWKVRKAASPILDRLQGPLRSMRFIEDAVVNPVKIVDYIRGLRSIFERHGIEGVIFGHAGSGHVHVNLLMNPHDRGHHAQLLPIANEVAELVVSLKGTLSGEHGDGILRAAWASRVFGDLVPVFEEIKRTFDPKGILNPGKKVRPPDYDFTKDLRPAKQAEPSYDPASPFARWTVEIERCNGCGHCRTYCPVYQEIPEEAASPRGKAVLLSAVLEGTLKPDVADLRRVADLCINCKLCLVQCPSRVDIPGMCLEAKALDVAERGLSPRDAMFAHVRENSALAARWAPLSNWLMPVVGAFKGVKRSPKFVKADVRPTKKSSKKVLYFAGCFADYNDPLGEKSAAIEILERNGFEVEIPEYKCCGLAALSVGARMEAVECAQHNVNLLKDSDLPIVTSAPSCGLMLKSEVPGLLPEWDSAKAVAKRVVDVHDFLWGLHGKGELAAPSGRLDKTVVLHPTCHLRAMGADRAARSLLKLIPGVSLVEIPERCCGMAGSFGMKAETYDLSQAIGRKVFADVEKSGAAVVTASNGTCRMHIAEGCGREVPHTLTLLREAYLSDDASRT